MIIACSLASFRTQAMKSINPPGKHWHYAWHFPPASMRQSGRLETVAGRSVLLLNRFDRAGTRRIPFLSAMSLLGASDNESHSYLEIVDALRQCSARTQ